MKKNDKMEQNIRMVWHVSLIELVKNICIPHHNGQRKQYFDLKQRR